MIVAIYGSTSGDAESKVGENEKNCWSQLKKIPPNLRNQLQLWVISSSLGPIFKVW